MFVSRNMFFLRNIQNSIPGNPPQRTHALRRRIKFSSLDDKNIVAGAFGNISQRIKHDCFLKAAVTGLNLGQNIIQII